MKISDRLFYIIVGIGFALTADLFGWQQSLKRAICTPNPPALVLWVK